MNTWQIDNLADQPENPIRTIKLAIAELLRIRDNYERNSKPWWLWQKQAVNMVEAIRWHLDNGATQSIRLNGPDGEKVDRFISDDNEIDAIFATELANVRAQREDHRIGRKAAV